MNTQGRNSPLEFVAFHGQLDRDVYSLFYMPTKVTIGQHLKINLNIIYSIGVFYNNF